MIQKITFKQKIRNAKIVCFLALFSTFQAFNAVGQITWEFSNAGATGRMGPSQSQINTAYLGTSLEGDVTISGDGIQIWTVPATGAYKIDVYGAQGGGTYGGFGAEISGEVDLTEGDQLKIVVGQKGSGTGCTGGGGGGSFVTTISNTPLIIAGGGGASNQQSDFLKHGSTGNSGNQSTSTATGQHNGLPGVDGQGSTISYFYATGAGGLLGNGTDNGETGGRAFINGALGGAGTHQGGFGGGASTSASGWCRFGGGGGYSGGATGLLDGNFSAGGGGSFNAGSQPVANSAIQANHGMVKITQLYNVALLDFENASCLESADGKLTARIVGGQPPYTFEWSNGVTTFSGIDISGYTLLGNIGEHSYYRSDIQMATLSAAQADAETHFGNVVTVNSAEESTWLMANGVQVGDNLGGSDSDVEGNWVWSSGESFSYSNWAPGEPNNGGGNQSFMQIYGDGTWDDVQWASGSYVRHIMELSGISTIENLEPSEYTVTVTDAMGTETTSSFTIGPDSIEISFVMTPSGTCDEDGDGALEAVATGGTAPYSYLWSTSETGAIITDKSIGEYTVFVTDANDCASVQASASILSDDSTEPTMLVKEATLYLDESGEAQVSITDVDNGSFDDCSLELSLSQTDYNCADLIAPPATFYGETALTLDGTDDYVTFNSVISQSPNHTIAAWVKTSSTSRSIFGWGGAGVNNYAGMVFQGGNIRYYAGNGTPPLESVTGSVLVADGSWHHVAVSRSNGGEVKIFVDGMLDVTGTVSKYVNNVTQSSIGSLFANGAFQLAYQGQIDEFALWSEVLSEEEIAQLSCNGPQGSEVYLQFEDGAGSTVATDFSVNENHAQLVNMDVNASWTDFGEPVLTPDCPSEITTTLIGVDLSGNTASAKAILTVLDTISPVASAQGHTLYLNGIGEALLNPSDLDNGSTDNCSVDNFTASKTAFNCSNLGMNNVILTAADISGNTASAATQVEVLDNTSPTVVVENINVFLNGDGEASIVPEDVEVSATDNCQIASRVLSLSAFTCADLGQEIEVVLTVTDNSGNETQQSAVISVVESIAPVAVAQTYTIELDENGEAAITSAEVAQFIGSESTDNCGLNADSHTLSQMTFSCENLGANTLTYSVADASGNSDDATVIITVVDGILPVAIAQDLIVELDAEGVAVISADDADNGSTDNCSIASRSLNTTAFSCENVGEQEVILTVTDASGNESQTTFIVNVVDEQAPAIPELLTMNIYLDEEGVASFNTASLLAEATDNCGVSHIGDIETGQDVNGFPITCEFIGETAGELLLVDVNGNTTLFSVFLNVVDTIKPAFNIDFIEIVIDDEGNAYLNEQMLMPYASDNCAIAEVAIQHDTYDCGALGSAQYTEILVYDMNGNARQQTLEVQVIDITVPEVQVGNITIALNEDGVANLDVEQLEMLAHDNCAPTNYVLSKTVFSCTDMGSNTVGITVADAAGNTGVAEFMVTVVDSVAPQIVAPEALEFCYGTPVSYEQVMTADNCSSELILVDGPQAGATPEPGEYMVEFEAVDLSGNAATAFVWIAVTEVAVVDLGEDMEVEAGATVILVAGENPANEYEWSNGYSGMIYEFTAIEDVTLSVEVTTPQGCISVDEITISIYSTVGIDDATAGNSVNYYPNPTRGQMSIALSLTEVATDVEMRITDITGKLVYQNKIPTVNNGDVISHDFSNYANGIYLVNLQSETFNFTERVVKQ